MTASRIRAVAERSGPALIRCGGDRRCPAGVAFTWQRIGMGVAGGRQFGRSPFGVTGSPLQSPLRWRFPLRSLSPSVAALPARCACKVWQSDQCIHRRGCARPHRRRGPCRWRDNYSSDVMDHCATRAHCANPLRGSSTPLRSVAAGTRNETALARLGPTKRATVAQSLRSLRPHHSRISPGHSFRPRWLRCARVSQRTITSGIGPERAIRS